MLSRYNRFLLKAFVILGPLGNLLTPHLISHAFRTYYFLLITFPLFYIVMRQKQIKIFAFFVPFFLYALSSLQWADIEGGDFPFFRLCLLISQFLFVLGASYHSLSYEAIKELIILYLKAFFASMMVGYFFYIGFYLHLIPFEIIEKFSVITQMGYGFLRFSPGSYPNEYGIVTSYVLSVLTLFLFHPQELSKRFVRIFYGLALIVLLLTTTRAAYLSYVFTLFYLAWKEKRLYRSFMIGSLVIGLTIGLLAIFRIDIFNVLGVGFHMSNWESGSLRERFLHWIDAKDRFLEGPWHGNGFSVHTDIHNVYLQLVFELGILGICTLLAGFVLIFVDKGYYRFSQPKNAEMSFIKNIIKIGLIHIFWFAISNHNMNHHLTWFVVLIYLSYKILEEKKYTQYYLSINPQFGSCN